MYISSCRGHDESLAGPKKRYQEQSELPRPGIDKGRVSCEVSVSLQIGMGGSRRTC